MESIVSDIAAMTAILDRANTASAQKSGQLPSLSKESVAALHSMAHTLYQNGKYEDAKGFFLFLTLVDGKDRRFWMGLAACYQLLKNYPEAIECYSVAAIQNPEDPYAHLHAAECFFHSNDKPTAIKTLESAISVAKIAADYQMLIPKLELLLQSWTTGNTGANHG